MKCLFCNATPAKGATLYRVNAKGQPGVWACGKHIKQTDASISEEVKQIVDALKGDGRQGGVLRLTAADLAAVLKGELGCAFQPDGSIVFYYTEGGNQ